MSEEEIMSILKVLIGLEEFNKISYKENRAIQGLLDLYNNEKEKNKKLIDGQIETIEKILAPKLLEKFIIKDKIKEKIEEYKKRKQDLLQLPDDCARSISLEDCDEKIAIYEELLEERK